MVLSNGKTVRINVEVSKGGRTYLFGRLEKGGYHTIWG